jgi:hypothetical protein
MPFSLQVEGFNTKVISIISKQRWVAVTNQALRTCVSLSRIEMSLQGSLSGSHFGRVGGTRRRFCPFRFCH